MLGASGVLLLLGGGALTAHAYDNTRQELTNHEYGSVMWRDEQVDEVFPLTIGGRGGHEGGLYDRDKALWHRMGISPETDCDKGLTRAILKAAQDNGCKAVLRATYVDPTANMVTTLAVVVLPEGPRETGPKEKVAEVYQDNRATEAAVAAYAVPGTAAARWKDRNGAYLMAVPGEHMPYAVGASIGSADGHVAGELPGEFSEDNDIDRESWHADAQDLVELFVSHLVNLRRGETR
ncbi:MULTISPECIES: hypothetical protein [Streptomyces]|uniref:Uncharacterized protein n=2 Tax=Streptomyces TaxID=1883 RepID=A0A100Y9R5_9ACTN|nr:MULTISPECIES: hypothetical protein [Streptomyces]KUH40261.1 hypothetical protein ATE80_02895 [Streptomyces kanasensis]UUS34249.1 hypothetical protein NRO40_27750 [Streptomyces changanensis]